jgi:hypothetical protein
MGDFSTGVAGAVGTVGMIDGVVIIVYILSVFYSPVKLDFPKRKA